GSRSADTAGRRSAEPHPANQSRRVRPAAARPRRCSHTDQQPWPEPNLRLSSLLRTGKPFWHGAKRVDSCPRFLASRFRAYEGDQTKRTVFLGVRTTGLQYFQSCPVGGSEHRQPCL